VHVFRQYLPLFKETLGRRLAIGIMAADRTISKDAAHIIAGTPPLDLWVKKLARIHNGYFTVGKGCLKKN